MPSESGPEINTKEYIGFLKGVITQELEAAGADPQNERLAGMLGALKFFEDAVTFLGQNGYNIRLFTLVPGSTDKKWQGLFDNDGVNDHPGIPVILVPCESIANAGAGVRYSFDLNEPADQEIPFTLAHEVVHAIDHMLFLKKGEEALEGKEKELWDYAKGLIPRLSTYDMSVFMDREQIFNKGAWDRLEEDVATLFVDMNIEEYRNAAIPEFLALVVDHGFSKTRLSTASEDVFGDPERLFQESPRLMRHVRDRFLTTLSTCRSHEPFSTIFRDRFEPVLAEIDERAAGGISVKPAQIPTAEVPLSEADDPNALVSRCFAGSSTSGRPGTISFAQRYAKDDRGTGSRSL